MHCGVLGEDLEMISNGGGGGGILGGEVLRITSGAWRKW